MRFTIFVIIIVCIALSADAGLFAQDSENVEQIGSFYDSWGFTGNVVVEENLAFLRTRFSGIQIVDISNPEDPIVVGNWDDDPRLCGEVDVQNGLAYIVDSDGNLQIIDISDPSLPRQVVLYESPIFIQGVAVRGDYACVIGITEGQGPFAGQRIFSVINIRNPAQPEYIGDFPNISDGYLHVIISEDGNYAYTTSMRSFSIKDIRDPENPESVGYLRTNYAPTDICIRGEFAYLTDRDGLSVIDISELGNLHVVGTIEFPESLGRLSVEGDYAYVFDRRESVFYVVDISEPENLRIVGNYDNLLWAPGIVARDGYAYIAAGYNGLRILDISENDDIHEVGKIDIDIVGSANGLAILNDYVYIADGFVGLSMFDISNPENPQESGSLVTLGSVSDIDVQGNYAYALVNRSVRILDISDPDDLFQVSSVRTYRSPSKVIVQNYYAYVNGYAFQVIAVGRPENAGEIAELYLQAAGFTIQGNYAYVANSDGDNLFVVDIHDPPNPEVIHTYEIAGTDSIKDIAVQGNYIYFANTEMRCGLSILDISDPEDLIEVNQPDTLIYPTLDRIEVVNNLAYIASGLNGFRVVDVSDPENPVNVGYFDTPGYARDLSVLENGLIYVADETNVGIYRFNDPNAVNNPEFSIAKKFGLFMPYPNPFNSTTTITYGLSHPGGVSLQLYNPMGQQISTLFEGNRQTGIYSTNLTGSDLASGLYFVRLEASGQVFTQKVMLVR